LNFDQDFNLQIEKKGDIKTTSKDEIDLIFFKNNFLPFNNAEILQSDRKSST